MENGQPDSLLKNEITTGNSPSLKKFSSRYSVDLMQGTPGVLIIKLWLESRIGISKIVASEGDKIFDDIYVSAITYLRPDVEELLKTNVIGITILIASQKISFGKNIKVGIVQLNGETLLISGEVKKSNFSEMFDGILFDLERRGSGDLENMLLNGSNNLLKFLSAFWMLELTDRKKKIRLIKSKKINIINTSFITIFYKNQDLATMFLIASNLTSIGSESELVICFQESSIFQKEIEIYRYFFEKMKMSYKLVLFEDNVGFSAANNLAASYADGDNLIFINPDVYCSDHNFYKNFSNKISENIILGATLKSNSDEVMHNGIELNAELVFFGKSSIEIRRSKHVGRHMQISEIKVGKLIPQEATSGALIGVKKNTFEHLGGFSEEYIFAHFEDLDLCLRAKIQGIPTLIYQNKDITHIESYSSGSGVPHILKLINSSIFNKKL